MVERGGVGEVACVGGDAGMRRRVAGVEAGEGGGEARGG